MRSYAAVIGLVLSDRSVALDSATGYKSSSKLPSVSSHPSARNKLAMTSQYDDIGANYNVFKHLPTSVVETKNVKDAVLPYLSKVDKPRVLDLACGTGYYSHKLLEWGAGYVFGVDLSKSMVEVASQTISEEERQAGVLRFETGNAVTLGKINDEQLFDVSTGVWLLNYSSSLKELTQMFRSISANLKDGGVFVGVVPPPRDDIAAFAEMTNEVQESQGARWGVTVNYYEQLESGEGWRTEVTGHGEPKVSFRNYHLKKSIYEEAARAGGMGGMIMWKEIKLPQEAIDKTGPEFWDTYFTIGPHMGLIVVEK
jgi:SAM-dependent methyltransferase